MTENTTICVRVITRAKLRKIAEIDRRDLLEIVDLMADESLRTRNIDPDTLQPANKPLAVPA